MNYDDEFTQQKIIFKAVSRMAFERNPKKQIHCTTLDYNSLKEYKVVIGFEEGMNQIKILGNEQDCSHDHEASSSCIPSRKIKYLSMTQILNDKIKIKDV
tara:strand:+ start:517 stop:816 length:300 start_codon:yes stop_codon:yes gene_type:complete